MSEITIRLNGGKAYLPPVKVGDTGLIECTLDGGQTIEVYPAEGETIAGIAPGIGITLNPGESKTLTCTIEGEAILT